jgi:hypothetical protein
VKGDEISFTPPYVFVNEILSPFTYTDTDDYIVLLYGSSDTYIQPDDGLIRKGRNM